MSKEYDLTIQGHPNIYNNNSPRSLKIFFSEPNSGVNEETGIVLLIPGFGGHSNSKVYKKMRSVFADKYNLVSIQCDYFGLEFMQNNPLPESRSNFNDMGIMQALDNITVIGIVEQILKDNSLNFNAGKVIAYGHSHGAYLAYLMNVLSPDLLTLVIDNSAWLYPKYVDMSRELFRNNGEIYEFNYIAKNVVKDKQLLDLNYLYMYYNNNCKIHAFHGSEDSLITLYDKKSFCEKNHNCFLHEVNENNIDLQVFKSLGHGLNADFLGLFDLCMKNKELKFQSKENIGFKEVGIATNANLYSVTYSSNIPILSVKSIKN